MCSLVSVFTLFYLLLENMSTTVRQFRFPCYILHLSDVMYNWFNSLLPPIVLNNLFGIYYIPTNKNWFLTRLAWWRTAGG